MQLTTQIDITTYRRIPTGNSTWEMQINIKTIEYKVGEIGPGQVFGLEEVLLKDVERCVQAKALTDGELQEIGSDQLHEIFNEDDIDIILKSGEMNFIKPVQVAKEFINFKKAISKRKKIIMDAAKVSPHFDTSHAFFNDVTHRKNNTRIQRWVDSLAPTTKLSQPRCGSKTFSDPFSSNNPSVMSS